MAGKSSSPLPAGKQEVEVVLLGEGRRVAEALRGGGACQLLSLSTVEKLLVCMISPLGGKGGWGVGRKKGALRLGLRVRLMTRLR